MPPAASRPFPAVVAIEQASNLGDVVSCLPMAAALKQALPGVRVLFIARPYTRALVESCVHIDGFLDVAEVLADPMLLKRHAFISPFLSQACGEAAHAAGVPIRVGNLRRLRTLRWANRFIAQGSRHSARHITELNLSFLRPLGIHAAPPADSDHLGLEKIEPLQEEFAALLDPQRFNLVLHAKSNKNAREWPAAYFEQLLQLLPPQRFKVFLTGVAREREELLRECPGLLQNDRVVDLMGKLSLPQLIAFYRHADGLVGNSTGPLHIAAALGTHTLGLYPGRERANPQRWAPIGSRAETLSLRSSCKPGAGRCPKDYRGEACSCMLGIEPATVAGRVQSWGLNPLRPAAVVPPAGAAPPPASPGPQSPPPPSPAAAAPP